MKLITFITNNNNIITKKLKNFLKIHFDLVLLGIFLFLYFSIEFSRIVSFILDLSFDI
jgi:hypothetical protein